jgi:hypothetical protein
MGRLSTGWNRSATNSTEFDVSRSRQCKNVNSEERTRSLGYRNRLHGTELRLWPGHRQAGGRQAYTGDRGRQIRLWGISSAKWRRKSAPPAQIALAWLLAQKPWIVPIPGTTKLHRLVENIGAAEVELSADDLRDINDVVSKITVQGARYPAHLQQRVGR